jgi:hypothetical protein
VSKELGIPDITS